MKRNLTILLLTCVAVSFIAGCNKFTRSRYELVHPGMSELEVKTLLGKPYHKFSDSWTFINDEPYYRAKIAFENGKVIDKAWADFDHGIDDDPDGKKPIGDTPSVIVESKLKGINP